MYLLVCRRASSKLVICPHLRALPVPACPAHFILNSSVASARGAQRQTTCSRDFSIEHSAVEDDGVGHSSCQRRCSCNPVSTSMLPPLTNTMPSEYELSTHGSASWGRVSPQGPHQTALSPPPVLWVSWLCSAQGIKNGLLVISCAKAKCSFCS